MLALGALVKLVLVLPLAALVLWAWRRGDRRTAFVTGATATAVLAVPIS